MSVEYVLRTPSHPPGPRIDYAAALNAEQLAAATAPPGPILVIAGAGSGKTRTLTYRVAYLIENGIEPENILLLTFTNKAAREMLHRVGALLPHDISRIWGGTFHSVGNRIMRRHANQFGYGRDFTIMDANDAEDLAASCRTDAGLDTKDKTVPKGGVLLEIFSLSVNKEKPLREIIESQFSYLEIWTEQLERAQRLYGERKKAANVMDYDDLLLLPLRLMKEFPEVRQLYQNQFQHVLVDEYQDTNKIQADLIDQFAAVHKQIMVVGDDAQSIYSWRGADFRNILTFPERYAETQIIRIETNYRSTPEILTLANTAIAVNTRQFPKELRSMRPGDKCPKPALIVLDDSNQQAAFIAQRVMELHEEGVELSEIAVLYRSHFHSLEIQMELTRRQIPFELTSGLRFFEQAHVKDVSSFLKLTLNPRDELAFLRIARLLPGVGAKTAEKIWRQSDGGTGLQTGKFSVPAKAAAAWKQFIETMRQLSAPELKDKISDQIQLVIDAMYEDYMKAEFPNYQIRLEDLSQLQAFSQTFETTEEFLAQLALLTNVDGRDEKGHEQESRAEPKLRLSTVHQAKGLEWKAVFVVMLCDGCFPSARSIDNPDSEEEERRLFYVAVTRAKDELYLSYPTMRASANSGPQWQIASRFLSDLPRELTNQWKIVR